MDAAAKLLRMLDGGGSTASMVGLGRRRQEGLGVAAMEDRVPPPFLLRRAWLRWLLRVLYFRRLASRRWGRRAGLPTVAAHTPLGRAARRANGARSGVPPLPC
jgi:hypothetical protein